MIQQSLQLSFEELPRLFGESKGQGLVLHPTIGDGAVHIYPIEKGLQARAWDCSFHQALEISSPLAAGSYYTLAYFPDRSQQHLLDCNTESSRNVIWDMLFTSTTSRLRLQLSPNARTRCLSISFTRQWLERNISEANNALENLRKELAALPSFLHVGCMETPEKQVVSEILERSWKRSLGSFYMKSAVLKMISDFFTILRDSDRFTLVNCTAEDPISEIEKIINSHVTGKLPSLKVLAQAYSLSESTLKRQFKLKHQVPISAYFLRKKMAYARRLMEEKNLSIEEAAESVGYQSVQNFLAMYAKYS